MGQPVVHFEILGADAGMLQGFYRELFDWKVDASNQWNYGMVETGGEGGINGGIASGQDGGSRVLVYVQVPDLQAALDKAERLGGTTVMPPMEIPGAVTLAQFRDPAGNVIGLVKG